jgi:hypothetical protein
MTMNPHSLHSTTALDVACVLYSAATGKILFTHRFTVLGEGPRPSEEQLEKETRAAFEKHRKQFDTGHSVDDLAALIVPSDQFHPGHTHSIDVKRKRFVAEPRPRHTQ